MTEKPRFGLANPHPLSQLKTELVWDGKYDEYGNRRVVDIAGCAMPMQKIETIDEPRSRAAAEGQIELFEKTRARIREESGQYPKKTNGANGDFRNRLIWGDNKLVMASLLAEFKGRIDLIYIDPPFDVGADFTMDVPIGDEKETVGKDQSTLEMVAYRDMWGKGTDSYLHMMYERLTLMKELLSENGSIYVHCDYRVNSHLRLILEELFGSNNFHNEIAWQRTNAHNEAGQYGRIHDTIFFFTKAASYTWHPAPIAFSPEQLGRYKPDEKGRLFTCQDLTAERVGSTSGKFECEEPCRHRLEAGAIQLSSLKIGGSKERSLLSEMARRAWMASLFTWMRKKDKRRNPFGLTLHESRTLHRKD